ncbi:MAG: DUF1203 domain-containing protein [Saprospiraceae bacterium]|nr:DUF1203 domain-containing protein [Saprospiraceae bacterium]
MSDFQISALPAGAFEDFFAKTDAELAQLGARRVLADKKPGCPCRVSLSDAEPGEELLLLHYLHHDTGSPYQASGPVFVRKNASTARPGVNEIPPFLLHRLLSVRGYDEGGMMVSALVCEGVELASRLHELFANRKIAYIHVHNAKPGCFNCAVYRAAT